MTIKRIVNREISLLGGVLSGIAYHFEIPSWILRIIFVVATVSSFFLLLFLYILAWIFMPKAFVTVEDFEEKTGINKRTDMNKDIETVEFKEVKKPEESFKEHNSN